MLPGAAARSASRPPGWAAPAHWLPLPLCGWGQGEAVTLQESEIVGGCYKTEIKEGQGVRSRSQEEREGVNQKEKNTWQLSAEDLQELLLALHVKH